MATKTISVDLEAYKRLKEARRNGESFSEVIKRVVRRPMKADEFLAHMRRNALGPDAASAVEARVAQRRTPGNRAGRDRSNDGGMPRHRRVA